MPVLLKHESYQEMFKKLKEERKEVEKALMEHLLYATPVTRDRLGEEILDEIQVLIGKLDRLMQEGLDIEELSIAHLEKLEKKQWKFKLILEVNELD